MVFRSRVNVPVSPRIETEGKSGLSRSKPFIKCYVLNDMQWYYLQRSLSSTNFRQSCLDMGTSFNLTTTTSDSRGPSLNGPWVWTAYCNMVRTQMNNHKSMRNINTRTALKHHLSLIYFRHVWLDSYQTWQLLANLDLLRNSKHTVHNDGCHEYTHHF